MYGMLRLQYIGCMVTMHFCVPLSPYICISAHLSACQAPLEGPALLARRRGFSGSGRPLRDSSGPVETTWHRHPGGFATAFNEASLIERADFRHLVLLVASEDFKSGLVGFPAADGPPRGRGPSWTRVVDRQGSHLGDRTILAHSDGR